MKVALFSPNPPWYNTKERNYHYNKSNALNPFYSNKIMKNVGQSLVRFSYTEPMYKREHRPSVLLASNFCQPYWI